MASAPNRRAYLVTYDYGTGGIWAYLRADSPDQIHARFHDLKVWDDPPGWMPESERREIEERSTFDVETADQQHPTFTGLLRESN